jgi:hypothetical protein
VLASLGNNELKMKLKSKPVKEMKKTTKKTAPTSTTVAAAAASKPAGRVSVAGKSVAAPVVSKPVTTAAPVAPKAATLTAAAKSVATTVPVVNKPSSPKSTSTTTIEARIDVGFGNQLFVRGQGEGLSWDRGVPLQCVDSQTWRLVVPAKDKLQIKLLINDSVWAKGEDVVVTPGKRVELVPAF